METIIQISEVNSKDVNTSRGASTVYNVKAVDGREFSTFKKDLGQQAGQLRGQWATVEYQEVQKGKYTNYYLDSVKPAPGLTTLLADTSEAVADEQAAARALFKVNDGAVTHNITHKDDKSAQINRSVAFKAAVELVGTGVVQIAEDPGRALEELNKLTDRLISVVDGTYVPFVAEKSQSSGESGDIVDKAGNLVDF